MKNFKQPKEYKYYIIRQNADELNIDLARYNICRCEIELPYNENNLKIVLRNLTIEEANWYYRRKDLIVTIYYRKKLLLIAMDILFVIFVVQMLHHFWLKSLIY